MKPALALIGPGKVGCAIAKRLYDQGYPLCTVVSRDPHRAVEACRFIGCAETAGSTTLEGTLAAEILLLAVPDDHLEEAAAQLPSLPSAQTQTLIHFSGRHPAEILRSAGPHRRLLSLHPLLPFADRALALSQLNGCPCTLEGEPSALPLGMKLVEDLGGYSLPLAQGSKPLYHAAACVASNYLVSLLDGAVELLSRCGIERQAALPLLLPLLRATLDNVARLGPDQGLTGPIVRGDSGTIQNHLDALEQAAPELLPLYRLLGRHTLELAERSRRLTAEQAQRLRQLFS